MNIIITFEIKRNHTEIRNELKTLGYKDSIVGTKIPNGSPIEVLIPNSALLKYDEISISRCEHEVVTIIKKYKGGLNCIFCAELKDGFLWSWR